jgi:hypothetical protein
VTVVVPALGRLREKSGRRGGQTVSWFTGKSAAKGRGDDVALWSEGLGTEFAQAQREGLLRWGSFERLGGQRIETVFLTRRTIFVRSYNVVARCHYGPLTVVPLDRILVAGRIGARSGSTRWGFVIAAPDANVERGEEPLSVYAYDCRHAGATPTLSRHFVAGLRRVMPASRFRVLPAPSGGVESARLVDEAILLAATFDSPALRSDLERAWEVLDARSRGLPVPHRRVLNETGA